MIKYISTSFLAIIILFSSCEKNTTLNLKKGETQLAVDAYLTNQPGEQIIKLRLTKGYLDNNEQPPANGAIVSISVADSIIEKYGSQFPGLSFFSKPMVFVEDGSTGNYKYPLTAGFDTLPIFGRIFNIPIPYTISITYQDETFKATTFKDNVPTIDSLTYRYRKQQINGTDTLKAGYVVTDMNCVDLKGEGNCYWLKSFRNRTFFNKPSEINLCYDGAFGSGSDGLNFIAPIAFAITPERLDVGDTLRVECHSIGVATFYYMSLAQQQMTNTGLFATPPVNVFTNVENINKSSKAKAVGFFTLATVSKKEIVIKFSPDKKVTE